MIRINGRRFDAMRPVSIIPAYLDYPEGSALITLGNTRVLCTVTIEERIPHWMQTQSIAGGWVTAEYAMLPRATQTRSPRETHGLGGRTQEIRRLIGRSLRASLKLALLGPRTCIIDCDVLQADGGTRTAAITGSYVALRTALQPLVDKSLIPPEIFRSKVAAVSAGIVNGEILLDLEYQEDSNADVDLNLVMNDRMEFIEIQSTAEKEPFSSANLSKMLDLAKHGITRLFQIQEQAIDQALHQ